MFFYKIISIIETSTRLNIETLAEHRLLFNIFSKDIYILHMEKFM